MSLRKEERKKKEGRKTEKVEWREDQKLGKNEIKSWGESMYEINEDMAKIREWRNYSTNAESYVHI